MTVRELVETLDMFNQDMEVVVSIPTHNYWKDKDAGVPTVVESVLHPSGDRVRVIDMDYYDAEEKYGNVRRVVVIE